MFGEQQKNHAYPSSMSKFKVVEVHFKEGSSDLQKAIDRETEQGWNFVTLSTYWKTAFDQSNKAHAVLVFSKG